MSNEIKYPEDYNDTTHNTHNTEFRNENREEKKDNGFKWWPLLLLPLFFFLGWASRGEPETNETRIEGVSTTGELYDARENNSNLNSVPYTGEPTYSISPQAEDMEDDMNEGVR